MLGTMMTVFITLSSDVRYNDDSICNLVTWCWVQWCDKVTHTVIIVPNITWQGYKYCHHCTQHHMTRLQIPSSLYPTPRDKVTNTVIIVPDITPIKQKMTPPTFLKGIPWSVACLHCTWHHVTRLHILSSLYPTSRDKVTNTVIIVPNITWQGYKYCHHCTQHHVTRQYL
jgi:hypothetical protein